MLDSKCLNWLRLNKFGYFTITDLKGSVVGRSENKGEIEELIQHFLLITDNLNPGTYTVHGQKDQSSSATKMSYSFVIAGDNASASIGYVANNDFQNIQQKMFDMQLEHQKQLFDMKLKALESEMKNTKTPKKDDTDALSRIAGIFETFAKIQPTGTATATPTATATAQVGNTNTPEEAVSTDLIVISNVLGDEGLAKTINNLAQMARLNPKQLQQFVNMLNS